MNGRRRALSYGPTGIVRFSRVFLLPSLMVWFVAGSGKSILWWVTAQPSFVDVAYIGDQFFNHKGHRIHACSWIGFNRLFLL
jgi:hypothetical protein